MIPVRMTSIVQLGSNLRPFTERGNNESKLYCGRKGMEQAAQVILAVNWGYDEQNIPEPIEH